MRSFALHLLLSFPLLCFAVDGCATGPVTSDDSGDLRAIGAASVERRGCPACHDPGDNSLSGQTTPRQGTMTYGTNLTPDPDTGLGSWTDEQIIRSLRYGLDYQRRSLCASMPRYSEMGTPEAEAEVAYLRSLVPVARSIPKSRCAPAIGPDGDAMDGGTDAAMEPPTPGGDLAEPADMALAVDACAAPDAAAPPAPIDMSLSPADGARGCTPLVNEIQTAGMAGAKDQFVELYNPCPMAFDLSGARLVYRSSSGVKDVTEVDFDQVAMAPGAFLVCGQSNYSGKADLIFKGQLSLSGGGVALKDPGGAVLDSAGWGDAKNAFVVGAAAAAPMNGQSIARIPDGENSGKNSLDFAVSATPTPGKKNH